MSDTEYRLWAKELKELAECIRKLDPLAKQMGISLAEQQTWFTDLFNKLLPQIDKEPILIVTVMGGTNTGKSTIFNYLVDSVISKVAPEAAGTKHPVCRVPKNWDVLSVEKLFPDFVVKPLTKDTDPVADSDELQLLFLEDSIGTQPQALLLLDTPDIDSVLHANEDKAIKICGAADVVVCILTAEKYLDDKVVRFFGRAAVSDKTFVVVFNKLHWPDDQNLISGWLSKFEQEVNKIRTKKTNLDEIRADYVYAVPYDRMASVQNQIHVYPWSPGAKDLRKDLAELNLGRIKLRSLRGSLRHLLGDNDGVRIFLQQITSRSLEYTDARATILESLSLSLKDLPTLPSHWIMNPIWEWLEPHRTPFDRGVHGAYSRVFGSVKGFFGFTETAAEEKFRQEELESYRRWVQQLFDQLDTLRKRGNDIIKDAVNRVLLGANREQMFSHLLTQYERLPNTNHELRGEIAQYLEEFFQKDHQTLLEFIKGALLVTAVLRPVITVTFLVILPGSEIVSQMAVVGTAHAARAGAMHVAHEAAQAWAIELSKATVEGTAGQAAVEGGGYLTLKKLLSSVHQKYYNWRIKRLGDIVNRILVSPVLENINQLAEVNENQALRSAKILAEGLKSELSRAHS